MKRRDSVSIGPGASSLILIFVMLSLSVLAMLSLAGANNDRQMGLRSIQVTEEIYALYEQAEQSRAQVWTALFRGNSGEAARDGLLPEVWTEDGLLPEVRTEEGLLCWEEGDGVYTLACAIDAKGNWVRHNLSADRAQMEDDWDEWG